MFLRAPMPTFLRTVTVRIPLADKLDAFETQTFVAKFRALTSEEADKLNADYDALPLADKAANRHFLLRKVTVGWSGVHDDNKAEVPFSIDALDQALQAQWVAPAMVQAWHEGMSGQGARLGN